MRANLKRLHSPDVDDLKQFSPKNPKDFAFLLQIFVGVEGSDGEDSFDLQVCTPAWLERECKRVGVVSGRHRLIVDCFDINAIEMYLQDYCENIVADDWDGIAAILGELGSWEFDGYRNL